MDFITQKIFNKNFVITMFRYGLVVLGTWLTATYGVDAGTWEVVAGSLLTILIALFGGAESTKDKVVAEGKNVDVAKLPPTVRVELKDAVEKKPARSIIDIFLGK